MNEQVRKPLPQSLMKAIRDVTESPYSTAPEKFEAVMLIAHGYGLYAALDEFNPTGYAIPEEQWSAIGGMLQAIDWGDQISNVNVLLDWMNVGPSAYRP